MHLPKFVLCSCGLRSFCRMLSMRMYLCHGKVAKYEAEFAPEILLYVFDYRVRLATIGAFIIAVFNQSRRRSIRPLDVVMLAANRQSQICSFYFFFGHFYSPLSISRSSPCLVIQGLQEPHWPLGLRLPEKRNSSE